MRLPLGVHLNPGACSRRSFALVLLALPALFIPASGSIAQEAHQKPVEITITASRFTFSPSRIEVRQDDIVKVTLKAEDMPHSFTIDEPYRIAKRAAPGRPATFEFRADKAGTFPFYCNLTTDDRCKNMRGELVVASAGK